MSWGYKKKTNSNTTFHTLEMLMHSSFLRFPGSLWNRKFVKNRLGSAFVIYQTAQLHFLVYKWSFFPSSSFEGSKRSNTDLKQHLLAVFDTRCWGWSWTPATEILQHREFRTVTFNVPKQEDGGEGQHTHTHATQQHPHQFKWSF